MYICLQESYANRWALKEQLESDVERMVSSLLADFSCFKYGEYILEELRLMLGKNPADMEQLYRHAKVAVEVLINIGSSHIKAKVSY